MVWLFIINLLVNWGCIQQKILESGNAMENYAWKSFGHVKARGDWIHASCGISDESCKKVEFTGLKRVYLNLKGSKVRNVTTNSIRHLVNMQLSSWCFFKPAKKTMKTLMWSSLSEASLIESQDWHSSQKTDMGMHFDFRISFDRTFFTTVDIGKIAVCNRKKGGKRSKYASFSGIREIMPCEKMRVASTETKWKTALPTRISCSRLKGLKRNFHFFFQQKVELM